MDRLRAFVTWPIAAVLIAGAGFFTLIVLFAPPGTRETLLGANGLLMTLIGILLRSPLTAPATPAREVAKDPQPSVETPLP